MSHTRRWITLALLVAMITPSVLFPRQSDAQVIGDTYTSPQYGYTITIGNGWEVLEESSELGYDSLIVSDFERFVRFAGGPAPASPGAELAGGILTCGQDGISNCVDVLDENGEPIRYVDDNRAYAVRSFDVEQEGMKFSLIGYYEIVNLGGGLSLAISAEMTPEVYDDGIGLFPIGDLMSGVSTPVGVQLEPIGPLVDGGGINPLPTFGGEPAPVFATNQWRVSIVKAVSSSDIPTLELEAKEGREWVVIIADVTNTSSLDGSFSLREPLLQTPEMEKPWDIAPSSTRQVARLLDLKTQGNADAPIPAGTTARVVLVYSIPENGSRTDLQQGQAVVSIDAHLANAFDVGALPEQAQPPVMQPALINGISAGMAGELEIGIESEVGEFEVLGVSLPTFATCHYEESLAAILDYIGADVELEFDSSAGSSSGVYVWITEPDGTRTMLNQDLIAQGMARYQTLPDSARFATWMESSEFAADEANIGLWATCQV